MRALRRWALRALRLAALVLLPFWLLVRGVLWLDQGRGWHPWFAFLGAALLTTSLLVFYAGWLGLRIAKRRGRRGRVWRTATALAIAIVVLFSGHSLLVLSQLQAKGPEERREYARLHPSLRLAIGSFRLVDDRILVTDIERDRPAYARLGLRAPAHSRHARQADGFVHAIDLRTVGRGRVRNALLQLYFESMGFETLRHVGTADHLHVALPGRAR